MLFVFGSDYFDVVERPMDLDTIRKWVEEAVYDRPVAARTPHEIVNAPSTPHLYSRASPCRGCAHTYDCRIAIYDHGETYDRRCRDRDRR